MRTFPEPIWTGPVPAETASFTAVIEHCPRTGVLFGHVPSFPGAHTQAADLDEMRANLREVIEMLLEDGVPDLDGEAIDLLRVEVPVPARARSAEPIAA